MIDVVESVTAGKILLQPETENSLKKNIITMSNPLFKPIANVIKTESGYTIIIPPQNIGGTKIEIEKLGGGHYLVSKTPSYYGARTEKIIMTEKELVAEFNGFKLEKDKNKTNPAKILKIKNPYDYFLTENGYIIKTLNGNNMTGAKTEIIKQANGSYLVKTTAYPGCPAETEILSERELVAKFKGEKFEDLPKFNTIVA